MIWGRQRRRRKRRVRKLGFWVLIGYSERGFESPLLELFRAAEKTMSGIKMVEKEIAKDEGSFWN